MPVPEGAEAMTSFSPDADWTFRMFFSILHLIETPSKILSLLRSDLSSCR
uniref:Uncharacterized protein n=1 Tax=Arundo donax TaxID=35708 RepID=A0A0A9F8B8_ARUDO